MPVTSARTAAVLAGPFDQGVHGLEHLRPDPGDLRAELAGLLQERQVALLPLMRGGGEEFQQRRAGIRRLEQPFADRVERVDAVEDDRGDQVVLGGEMAEHGALPHAGPAGDVGNRGVEAALGELVRGRRQQQLPVAGGVGTQRTRRGHPAILAS